MTYTILDCYTDEPSGLGVPPYLGTYPRYLYGYLALDKGEQEKDIKYLAIDDLRLFVKYNSIIPKTTEKQKTNITVYNLTKNYRNIKEILENTTKLIVICGVQAPGKYLSALPGTLREIKSLLQKLNLSCDMILTGPSLSGTQLEGGKFAERIDENFFRVKDLMNFSFQKVKDYSVKGAEIIKQIPDSRMIEIETARGCTSAKCSFCTEPLKNRVINRDNEDIVKEMQTFDSLGTKYFRLGKQACFYSIPEPIELLKEIRKECKRIEVFHIDNVNPKAILNKRGEEITKAVVKYCTPGNVAAFGIETFDKEVSELNTLNTYNEEAYRAIKLINKFGKERGANGMPVFLPGINILFGLIGENKKTHEENMKWLNKILDNNLLIRRINIRQVAIIPGTRLAKEAGNKFIKKNKKHYWKWRNEIRQNIDFPMLKRVLPKGTILKNIKAEIYDGKTTFGRQVGTYPLIVGIKGRFPLKEFYDVKVVGHMLRSVVGEVV